MTRYKYILTVCLLSVALFALAQDKLISGTGLEQRDFFDPTRTEKPQEVYQFGIAYHIEAGYAQNHQRMTSDTISALYLHGARLGAQFEMFLPKHFSLNIGVLYSIQYGISRQHYHTASVDNPQIEIVNNHILEHTLTIPIRAQYTISDSTVGIDNTASEINVQKIMRDGKILIIRNGKMYDLNGREL